MRRMWRDKHGGHEGAGLLLRDAGQEYDSAAVQCCLLPHLRQFPFLPSTSQLHLKRRRET